MAKPKAKQLLARLLSVIIVVAVLVFFANTLWSNWQKLADVDLQIDFWAIAAFVSFVLAVVVSGILWGRLANHISTGPAMSMRDAVRIHCASWLLKYIPGQAGSYLNKLAWGRKNGFTKKSITTSFIYENILMVMAGAILSLPIITILIERLPGRTASFLPYLLAVLVVIMLSPSVFRWMLNVIMKLAKRDQFTQSDFLSGLNIFRFQIEYLLPRLLNGVGFVLLAVSILPVVEPSMYLGLGASYILAGIVGMLAVFVPGGIGVRESVIVLLASAYMPIEQAVLLSLVARLYTTVADIGVALIYLSLNNWKLSQQ